MTFIYMYSLSVVADGNSAPGLASETGTVLCEMSREKLLSCGFSAAWELHFPCGKDSVNVQPVIEKS